MGEPGRFSLERLVAIAANRRVSLVAAAVAIAVAVALGRETISEIPEIVEASYGYDAQLRATHLNRSILTGSLPVTFVDVDDEALQAWADATRTTPRSKIGELITRLAAKKPSVIFVDFDMSGALQGPGDEELGKALAAYPNDAPPLLLTKALTPLSCPKGICSASACPSAPAGSLDVSPFEHTVAKSSNIHWVSSLFAPDGDGVVRSWRLWEPTCKEGKISVLPSPQLAALSFASSGHPDASKLHRYLAYAAMKAQGIEALKPDWPKNAEARQALIPFLIRGSSKERVSGWMGDQGFRYQRVRAINLLRDDVADTAIAGRAIVVGASYGPDSFKTPFGTMPGAALIANAVAVAPAVLEVEPSSSVLLFLLSLALTTLYAVLAKTLRAIPAGFVILALSYIWLSLTTYWLNPADSVQTISYALLLLGAFLAIESVLEILIELPRHGLSALLRARGGKEPSGH